MRKLLCLLALALPLMAEVFSASPSDDLQSILDGLQPGDALILQDGVFAPLTGYINQASGTEALPITIRAENRWGAIIDAVNIPRSSQHLFRNNGSWTIIEDLQFTDSHPDRLNRRPAGLSISGPNAIIRGNFIHDTGTCFEQWSTADHAVAEENIFMSCGWDTSTGGRGHAAYIQSNVGQTLRRNVLSNGFGYGIHAYGSRGQLNNITLLRNISFANGSLAVLRQYRVANIRLGGLRLVAENPIWISNYTYSPLLLGLGLRSSNLLGSHGGCSNPVVRDNVLQGRIALALNACVGQIDVSNNTFVGEVIGFGTADNVVYDSNPTSGVWVYKIPLEHLGGFLVIIYNWDISNGVSVRAPEFQTFDVSSMEDPTVTRRLEAREQELNMPMTDWTVRTPVGHVAPPSTLPEFGVFWVRAATEIGNETGSVTVSCVSQPKLNVAVTLPCTDITTELESIIQ